MLWIGILRRYGTLPIDQTYFTIRYLQDLGLNRITAVAMNPRNLSDSRTLRTNTPQMLVFMSKFVLGPLRPLLRSSDLTLRTTTEVGADVIELAFNKASPGQRGFFTLHEEEGLFA